MTTKPDKPTHPPSEDDVLRRMLNSPPKKHGSKPAPANAPLEKKPATTPKMA
jgi:hypothetical protein